MIDSGTRVAYVSDPARRKGLFSDRLLRPALLDASVYAEILNDSSAALYRVLFLTSAAAALGHIAFGTNAVVAQFVAGLLLWLIGLGIARYLVTSDFVFYGVPAQQPHLWDLAVVLAYAEGQIKLKEPSGTHKRDWRYAPTCG